MTTATLTRINVERLDVLRTGMKNGKPWTLYQVHGALMDGEVAVERLTALKTFDALPVGEVAVELCPDSREEGWHLAKLPRSHRPSNATTFSGGSGSGESYAKLESRLARLERQMAAIIGNAEIDLP